MMYLISVCDMNDDGLCVYINKKPNSAKYIKFINGVNIKINEYKYIWCCNRD